jgi:type VI secretion system protein ImpE
MQDKLMQQLKQLIQQGQLTEAISLAVTQLKARPKDLDMRSSFIELLCIDGQFERADQQLNLLIQQHPECLPGAVNMRQLVRAAQARIDFSLGGDTATLVGGTQQSFAPLLEMRLALVHKDQSGLEQAATQLEAARESCAVEINNQACSILRDIDDTLAGYLEVFGANGKFYFVPFSAVTWLKLMPAESLFELIWRKAEIDILNGPSGEVFIPMTYLASGNVDEKLGRESYWKPLLHTEFYQGRGQKMWMVDDDALAVNGLTAFCVACAAVAE